MADRKTFTPTGLAIKREDTKYICTWKFAAVDHDDGQTVRWRTNANKFADIKCGKKTTQKTGALSYAGYYPYTSTTLYKVEFAVRGNQKAYKKKSGKVIDPTPSEWAYKTFEIYAPSAPSISVTLSDTYSNVSTFSWSVGVDTTSHQVFADCEYQSILVKESNVTDGSKLAWSSSATGWMTGTSGATGSMTITESTTLLAAASYTRWVRVRARGAGGASGWRYAKHVYAKPYQAGIKSASTKQNTAGGYLCTVNWSVSAPASHPIDRTVVQYGFGTPDTGMGCPDSLSWTDAGTIGTTGTDALAFSVDSVVGIDQCMFVRVNTVHDTNTTYGAAKVAAVGKLTSPSDLSVTTDDSTYRATVTATNNSAVADSFIAVYYMTMSNSNGICVGIIPHGGTSVTVQCPNWSSENTITFGVKTFVGSYTATTRADGVKVYALKTSMASTGMETYGGSVPHAPTNVALAMTDTVGTVQVTFDWTWSDADAAEVSWADHADAWMSTDEPETYLINNTHAARWNISGLEVGTTWYVRVRLVSGSGDSATYGAYSDTVSIDLSSAPVKPVLTLSGAVVASGDTVTASWVYVSTDGTYQSYAQVAEYSNGIYTIVGRTQTAQHIDIDTSKWTTGQEHQLAVRVYSSSGRQTDWSDTVSVIVAPAPTCTISSTSLVTQTITADSTTYTTQALTDMPFTATITGAGTGGTTSLSIVRSEAYHVVRPDETSFYGYDGESIVVYSQTGEAQISIGYADLIGHLDDGAGYTLIASVTDGLGQTAEQTINFEVHWSHQPEAPTAEVTEDDEHIAAFLVPTAPDGAEGDDVCDIYRLSVDKPQLIVSGAVFGETYVDPYPTVGEYGGYRFVTRTADGDYVASDGTMAWTDIETDIDSEYNIIDFDDGQVMLRFNADVSNKWQKDFKSTAYLGGAIQGDWNADVKRTSSVSAVAVTALDQNTIESMRRLAEHAGICHVRTKEGSSYPADVQVSESYDISNGHKLASFSLSITRVQSERFDGMTLAEWEDIHDTEA